VDPAKVGTMSDEVERMIDKIEGNLFTHNGKFPKGFEFIVMTDSNKSEVISAVYILMNDDGLLYVGQSRNVNQRIREHKKKGVIPFTKCAYLAIHPDVRNEMEASLIWNFKPPYNKAFPRLSDIARKVLRRGGR
jgi:hypothetical protein